MSSMNAAFCILSQKRPKIGLSSRFSFHSDIVIHRAYFSNPGNSGRESGSLVFAVYATYAHYNQMQQDATLHGEQVEAPVEYPNSIHFPLDAGLVYASKLCRCCEMLFPISGEPKGQIVHKLVPKVHLPPAPSSTELFSRLYSNLLCLLLLSAGSLLFQLTVIVQAFKSYHNRFFAFLLVKITAFTRS
ncbi:hypothetical protein EV361DRAFT_900890, partial [Lentinula raphanica]